MFAVNKHLFRIRVAIAKCEANKRITKAVGKKIDEFSIRKEIL